MRTEDISQPWQTRAAALGFDVGPSEKDGVSELKLGGHGLNALLEEYGSPLVLVSEKAASQVVTRLQAFTDSLGQSLRPRVRVGPATFNDSSGARIFSPVSASPTQDLLRRLQAWNVGFLAQCAGEVERALRAGARPANVILCGPFKSKADVILSAQLSLRALEVESLAEFEVLCEAEVKAACRLRPLRLCLRLEAPWDALPAGLAGDELLVVLERVRRLDHVVCVGLSASWSTAPALEGPACEEFLARLASLATDQLSSGHPLEFVMVGPRARLESLHDSKNDGSTGASAADEAADAHIEAMRTCFADAPFRVYLSSADAIFARAVHKLGRVLRVTDQGESRACYTDVRYLEGWPAGQAPLPLVEPRTEEEATDVPKTSVAFLGRSSFDHRPRVFGRWPWARLSAGDAVLFPYTGAAYGAAASASCSLPRPPEILVTSEGDVVVIRSRDTLESVLSNEV